jgi:hypothetical protein
MSLDKTNRQGAAEEEKNSFTIAETVDLEWEESKKMCPLTRAYFLAGMLMLKVKNHPAFVTVRERGDGEG